MASRILLVEDDTAIRELYQRALTAAGYEVLTAQDGEGALKAIKEGPEVVLLDVMLPVMNGMEVLKSIRATPETASLPVIMLTNLDEPVIRERAQALQATAYVVKIDINPPELLRLVKSALA